MIPTKISKNMGGCHNIAILWHSLVKMRKNIILDQQNHFFEFLLYVLYIMAKSQMWKTIYTN